MDEIKIAFPSLFLSLPEGARPAESLPLFCPGEVLQGRVLRQLDFSHFSLQLGGRTLVVESAVALPLSADLFFRVEETGPRTLLKLISPETLEEQTRASFLKKALATDIPLGQLAQKLSELGNGTWTLPGEEAAGRKFLRLLKQFNSSELMSSGAEILPKVFSQSGFFWENKVRRWVEGGRGGAPGSLVEEDLKGLGIRLLDHLKKLSSSPDPEARELLKAGGLKETLDSFLRKIELHQVLNSRPSEASDRFYLFVPFWAGNQMQFVEFSLSLPPKKPSRGGKDGFSVLFLLRLPAFGEVRIEARMKEKALFCRFLVSSEEIAEFIRRGISPLQRGLEKLGFQPTLQVATAAGEEGEAPFWPGPHEESPALLSIVI